MTVTEEAEQALQIRVKAGHMVEDEAEMTPRYREVLLQTMQIAADLEVMALPMFYRGLLAAPSLTDKISVGTAIQDEIGHAQVMYRMLDDFGINSHELVFERDAKDFKTFFLTQFGPTNNVATVVSQFLGDRAGYVTTCDLEKYCSFGPYARSLRKVNFEEQFHVRHGEEGVKYYMSHTPETREQVQKSMDFLFPMAAEWFGASDQRKKRTDQLLYKIRGNSNDELRQIWLSQVVPFCEKVGVKVPAHYNSEKGAYELDYELPVMLDMETGKWDLENTVSWEEKFAQWKKGGPLKIVGIEWVQKEVWGDDLWRDEPW